MTIQDYILGNNFKNGGFDGGGLRIEGDVTTIVKVKNTRISNNIAVNGGGIAMFNGNLTVTDCVFDGNKAEQTSGLVYGGAFFISCGVVNFKRCSFSNNSVSSC